MLTKAEILNVFQQNPVILGLKSEADFSIIAQKDSKIVFTLFGDISNIQNIVSTAKDMGKLVFINMDMVDGMASKNSAVDFIIKTTKADGIISSKPHLLHYAKEKGLFTIHRFFILDSSSWRSIGKQLKISKADIINVTPGWTKVIEWTVEKYDVPVIASGLVCDKPTIIDSLKAGALAICTTNHSVWNL